MALTSANLVGYLRAEFAKAAKYRVWLFGLQLAAAVPAALAVLISDQYGDALYGLAILSFGLLALWWFVNARYTRIRGAGQAALRGALLLGGLDEALSPSEIEALRERFTVTSAEAKSAEYADYYATKLPHGPPRLGEMLEESAFFSEQLHRMSALAMLGVLVTFALLSALIAFGITPYVDRDTGHAIVRVLLALLVFAMSADVIGAYRAHNSAAKEIRDVKHRLQTADAAGYPIADVLLSYADYLGAVEAAPEMVPYAYKLLGGRLTERWAEYQHDREERRKAQRSRQ